MHNILCNAEPRTLVKEDIFEEKGDLVEVKEDLVED